MTVCIAGICEHGKKIVCVTDQLLTFFPNMTAMDGSVFKDQALHKNWFALYAANDMGDVRPIIERATVLMLARQRDLALVEAMDIFTDSFAKRHQDLIEYSVIKPNGFPSYDDFIARGKDVLPADDYRRIRRLISKTKPGCEFLVTGFDFLETAHLFKQDSSGPAKGFDDPGWWAIGSGEGEAISHLEFAAHRLGLHPSCSEAMCVYHLLSAKFFAEANRLVGQKTFVTCHAFNEPIRYMLDSEVNRIRQEWERCAIPKIPKALIRRIPKFLFTLKEAEEMQEKRENFERKMFGRKLPKRVR